jgi:hypothetical protein
MTVEGFESSYFELLKLCSKWKKRIAKGREEYKKRLSGEVSP